MSLQKQRLDLFSETLRLAFVQQGAGRAFLLLHGGAGPGSMMGLAGALAAGAASSCRPTPGSTANRGRNGSRASMTQALPTLTA